MARPLRNDRQLTVVVPGCGGREPGTHAHGPRQLPRTYLNSRVPDGRMAALRRWRREESPGSTEARCRVTPGGGDPRESATESTPPLRLGTSGRAARVKRCGKSAPRRRQRRRQGKPHREQDQVGAAGTPARGNAGRTFAPPLGSVARGARQRASQRNGHPRPRTSSSGRDRTRLTRRLALFLRTFQELAFRAKINSWFYL